MFTTILIANRGAIATRVIRTLKAMNIRSAVVYHEADSHSLHVQSADMAICLGTGSAQDTYLNIDKIIAAAKEVGAEAIHPGYGFLSENLNFVARCEQEGLSFIGPRPEHIDLFGLKHKARKSAQESGVPLIPGSEILASCEVAQVWSRDVGYPVILKSTAGGGGIGMQVCYSEEDLISGWDTVKRLSENYFSNDDVFLEKFITNARHIEVQVFGDGKGGVVSIGERDCSAQRRNQKVIEECPAPNLSDDTREQMYATAERLMASVSYRNAGTVEYIFDVDAQEFYFLEVNTRLQVEHGVTEEVWGVDLVRWMVELSAGDLGDIHSERGKLRAHGHAVQARVYAEDPLQDALPSAGLLSHVSWPSKPGLRIDHWLESGIEVPALFDPMLAKVIVHCNDRSSALNTLGEALAESELYGIETNLEYLQAIISSVVCQEGKLLTKTLDDFSYKSSTVRVVLSGTQTTIQDYPARENLWHIGVPPSGPMDRVSFSLANHLVGNNDCAAALEITLNGPDLLFNRCCRIAICGAELDVTIDGVAVTMYETLDVTAGQRLSLGQISCGARAYLAVEGGFQCPEYLSSRSTFTLGQFGGHAGRALRVGDVLKLAKLVPCRQPKLQSLRAEFRPNIKPEMTLRVIYGPHGAPDFFTPKDIEEFFSAQWEVHYNSSRTGVRLVGPKPDWARSTGGEAGLHPSNIHDNAYAFGTIDFTGDMPVILGPDGPSLGGFVCPATVITADLWKLGQLSAGTKVRFVAVSQVAAVNAEREQLLALSGGIFCEPDIITCMDLPDPIVYNDTFQGENLVARLAGDHFLLVELGPLELNIERRFKINALMLALEKQKILGVRELTPGIRSLQIHYNSQALSLEDLLSILKNTCSNLSKEKQLKVPSRTVYLPLSWDDDVCREAIEKYTQSVRPGAPWCPSNLEFIRRINGLANIDAVKDVVFNASYLVMGLGDVYLGAPVATPLDPRHRLVTTKYNPARTWTAENSVGIGGAYMCVYGMEGPGGYQFVGRTVQMWNRYRTTTNFEQPWLLRFFDQIRFYEVSHDELHALRDDVPLGRHEIRIEEGEFCLEEYQKFLGDNDSEIQGFQQSREAAFDQELEQWKETGQLRYEPPEDLNIDTDEQKLPDGHSLLCSNVSGSVWSILKNEGDWVEKGEAVMVLESMKMELTLFAESAGRVAKVLKSQGQSVIAGQHLFWINESVNSEDDS
ncbi:MAG: urea carboxylase [Flavobacteriales bacterium]|jgi:urea carboxylase